MVEQLVTCAYEKSCRNVVQFCIKQSIKEVGNNNFGQTFNVGYTSQHSNHLEVLCLHMYVYMQAYTCYFTYVLVYIIHAVLPQHTGSLFLVC